MGRKRKRHTTAQLVELIQAGREAEFYSWGEWRRLQPEVLALDNWECQRCKARGKYRRAELVHHRKHLTERPDLALAIFDPDTGERQLVSLCKACHEEEHPESLRPAWTPKPQLTAERWD